MGRGEKRKRKENNYEYDFFENRDINRTIHLLYLLRTRDKNERLEEYIDAMEELISYGNLSVVPYERFRYLEKCLCVFF